ncbi:MAG: tRNA (adenosine(37)-N6)-threonylcarbamoyltransferase complex dimerization subunit type 1 TsaB [Nitrospirota bacterium]
MRLLAIETATMLGGIALIDDDTLIAESRMNVRVTHSERIMTEIDHVLKGARLSLHDMDAFALSIGPGSFTGLRVGLSTIKGLAYATGKGVVAVPTLEALAWNVPFTRHPVCPLLDARKKEVYTGLFKWTGHGFSRLMPEQAMKLETLLAGIDEPAVFLGEGAMLYRNSIQKTLGERALFAPPGAMVPSPAAVAHLGMITARNGEYEDPVTLTPLYLRKSEAELKQKKP